MNITELKTGTKLELELFNSAGIKLEQTLVSEFEWSIDENTAVIAAPIHRGVLFPIHLDTVINIFFKKRNEYETGLFRFKARVVSKDKRKNIDLLKIRIESEFEKIQRREYYRLGCTLSVQYRMINSPDAVNNEEIPYKKTLANDLSGGGISLLLDEKIGVGRLVECEILTGRNKPIRFLGQIVKFEKRGVEGRYRFKAGVEYIRITNKDREAVVKFIFEEQRKLREKGLI